MTFHFQEVTTPISAHAYTKPVSEQSKHPNNAYVICVFECAAQSDWTQNPTQFTCKWPCGARLSEFLAGLHHFLAPPGMPKRPCCRSMDRADGTSTARPQRSAGLRWYFMTWRESYSRVIITYRTFRICAFRSIANSYELLCRPYVQMTMRRPARQ